MTRLSKALIASVAVVFIALGIAACGGDDDDDSGGGGKEGGSIKIGSVLPDKYDPTQNQTIQAYQAQQLVYTPLNTFKHVAGQRGRRRSSPGSPSPCPKVSNGGKTYKLKLRSGLKYSDGTPDQGQRLREHHQAPGRLRRPVLFVRHRDRGHRQAEELRRRHERHRHRRQDR